MNISTDEQLVRQYLQNKEEGALEELIRRYLPLIFGFVKKYNGNEDNASDITQETFVKVWKNLKSFDQSKNFKTWIFTIAKRTAIDWLKKRSALPFSMLEEEQGSRDFIDSLADKSLSILEQLLLKEISKKLAVAMAKLPAGYGNIIKYHIDKDLSFCEIAKELNEPLNTVKSRYRRGLILLKKVL